MAAANGGAGPADRLVTPEAVPLDHPLATVGSRAVAQLLDQALLFAVIVGLALAGAAIAGAVGPLPPWLGTTLLLLLVLTVQLGYPIVLETTWRGRTLGKAALGLRVVTTSGGPIGIRHAALRALLAIVDFQLTAGVAALTTAMVTRRHQRLGDLAAGTVVVRDRTAAEEMTSVTFAAPAPLRHYASTLDVTAIDVATYQTMRAFLRRADGLSGEVRVRLARDLAERVRPRIQPPPPMGTPDEAFLLAVAAAVQARRAPSGDVRPAARSPETSAAGPSGTPVAPPPRPVPRGTPARGDGADGGAGFTPPS